MKQFWRSLQERERYVLMATAGMLALFLMYILVIEPWQSETRLLRQNIAEQQKTLQWMKQAAEEIQQLRQLTGRKADSGQSLMTVIDDSAREAGISSAVRQLRPDGNGVSVRLEEIGFDAVIKWLSSLHTQHGISVNHFSMERLAQTGQINANVLLAYGGV